MVHTDNGWDWGAQKWFYDTVLGEGPLVDSDFDLMGVSFYPFYGKDATLEALRNSLGKMYERYGKSLLVVETDWPVSCPNPEYPFPADLQDISFSVQGQTTFLEDLLHVLDEVQGADGIYYWEPAWIGNGGLGSSCRDVLMVESSGKIRESIKVFGEM